MSDPITAAINDRIARIAFTGQSKRQQYRAMRDAYVETDALWLGRLTAMRDEIAATETEERDARQAVRERIASERMQRGGRA